MMPWRLAYWPVTIEARLGEQIGVVRALEHRAFGRQAVDVRRLHVRVAAGAEFVVAQVVDQDDDEVGLHGPPV